MEKIVRRGHQLAVFFPNHFSVAAAGDTLHKTLNVNLAPLAFFGRVSQQMFFSFKNNKCEIPTLVPFRFFLPALFSFSQQTIFFKPLG